MAPSTEQTDALLEWRPGPPDAATTNVLRALGWGSRRASRAKLLLLLLWAVHAAVALGGGRAVLDIVGSRISPDEAAGQMVRATLTGDIFGRSFAAAVYRAIGFESTTRMLWEPSPYFVLFYALLAGGIIAYLFAPRPAPLLAQLGAACGTYAGRFVRLLVLATLALFAIERGADLVMRTASGPPPLWAITPLVVAYVLFSATIDYARVRTVARDSRSMLIEGLRSGRFFLRNLPRTLALEVLIIALLAVVAAAALGVAATLRLMLAPPAADFIAGQLLVVGLLWARLAAWGAMLALYQGITLERLSGDTDR
jgi:hypothetical protein